MYTYRLCYAWRVCVFVFICACTIQHKRNQHNNNSTPFYNGKKAPRSAIEANVLFRFEDLQTQKKIPVHLKCVSELLEGIFAVLTTDKQTCQLKIPVIDFCKIHQGFDLSAERRLCQVESKLKATFSNLFSIFIESPLYIFFSSGRSVEETNSHLLLRLYTMRIQKNRATR